MVADVGSRVGSPMWMIGPATRAGCWLFEAYPNVLPEPARRPRGHCDRCRVCWAPGSVAAGWLAVVAVDGVTPLGRRVLVRLADAVGRYC
jgi:hypothetical protein